MQDELLQSLPPDAQTALMNLIGSTFSELKKVENNIVGDKKPTIAAMKTDLNRLVEEAKQLGAPQHQPQAAYQQVVHQAVPQLIPQPAVLTQPMLVPQPVVVQQLPEEDPNQLQFDFYKKITPEDIHGKLSDINFSLKEIVDKLNKVLTILPNGTKRT